MGVVAMHEQTIDGVTYKTPTLPATDAIDLGHDLARYLGAGLVDLIMKNPENYSFTKLFSDPVQIGGLLVRTAAQAPPGEMSALAKKILKRTVFRSAEVEGDVSVATVFDGHFAGRLKHLFAVLAWVLSVSFGGP